MEAVFETHSRMFILIFVVGFWKVQWKKLESSYILNSCSLTFLSFNFIFFLLLCVLVHDCIFFYKWLLFLPFSYPRLWKASAAHAVTHIQFTHLSESTVLCRFSSIDRLCIVLQMNMLFLFMDLCHKMAKNTSILNGWPKLLNCGIEIFWYKIRGVKSIEKFTLR